jgi:hypothetical protein
MSGLHRLAPGTTTTLHQRAIRSPVREANPAPGSAAQQHARQRSSIGKLRASLPRVISDYSYKIVGADVKIPIGVRGRLRKYPSLPP